MAGVGRSNGFSLLVWVDPETWRYVGLDEEQRDAKELEIVEDVVTLFCGRWGMEGSIVEERGIRYAFFTCPNFVVGTQTLSRALGDLSDSVKYHRGSPSDTAKGLINYKLCLEKYNVPDKVSEGSFGEGSGDSQYTSAWGAGGKRLRKS